MFTLYISRILLMYCHVVNCKIKPNIMLRYNVIYVDTICLCGLHGWSSDSHQSNLSFKSQSFLSPWGSVRIKEHAFPRSLPLAFTIQWCKIKVTLQTFSKAIITNQRTVIVAFLCIVGNSNSILFQNIQGKVIKIKQRKSWTMQPFRRESHNTVD